MARALELAARAGAEVEPNPRVGAVLVAGGRVLGEGWHRGPGLPHAEREALAACEDDPAGATLYVTLEPCHRQGRTPPCTEAIVAAGIGRVVYALEDPNPAERGRSHRLLAEAGLEVTGGLMAGKAEAANEVYVHFQRTGRPHVVLKSAATLNGMLARADGSSRWITGEPARREGHRLRGEAMAVAVGGETARLDRPRLDVRLEDFDGAQPRPVVFDGDPPRCPGDLDWEERAPLLLLPERALEDGREYAERGWRVLGLPVAPSGGLDLDAALRALADEGITSILVEGGGRLVSSFLAAGLWQRWELFLASRLFPADGRPVWTSASEMDRLRIAGLHTLGEDLRITLLPPAKEETACSPA